MSSHFDVAGRVALVTGSSRSIGHALANDLATEGAILIIHGRNADAVAATVQQISAADGVEAGETAFDVTNLDEVTAGIATIEEYWGRPRHSRQQCRYLAAGLHHVVHGRRLERHRRDKPHQCVSGGTGRGTRDGRARVGQDHQHRLCTELVGMPWYCVICGDQGGVAMLSKGMRTDLAHVGIRTNALAPGYFAAELSQVLVDDEALSSWARTRTPAGR